MAFNFNEHKYHHVKELCSMMTWKYPQCRRLHNPECRGHSKTSAEEMNRKRNIPRWTMSGYTGDTEGFDTDRE